MACPPAVPPIGATSDRPEPPLSNAAADGGWAIELSVDNQESSRLSKYVRVVRADLYAASFDSALAVVRGGECVGNRVLVTDGTLTRAGLVVFSDGAWMLVDVGDETEHKPRP